MNKRSCLQTFGHRPLQSGAGSPSEACKTHKEAKPFMDEEPPAPKIEASPSFVLGDSTSQRDGPEDDDHPMMAAGTSSSVAANPMRKTMSIDLDALLADDARKLEFLRVRSSFKRCCAAPHLKSLSAVAQPLS